MRYHFLLYWLLLSFIAFVMYGAGKHCARRRAYRVPEAALLLLGFFGGAFGALGAMQFFRHKTKCWYFYVVNAIGLVWQLAFLGYLWLPI